MYVLRGERALVSVEDARRGALRDGELGAGLEEGLEDCVRPLVVVVHDVHEGVRVHHVVDQRARRRARLVVLRPLPPELVRLVLPAYQPPVSTPLENAGEQEKGALPSKP